MSSTSNLFTYLKFIRCTPLFLCALVTACASLNSTPPRITNESLLKEQQIQLQQESLTKQIALSQKAHGLIWPLLTANADFCEKKEQHTGLVAGSLKRWSSIGKLPVEVLKELGEGQGIRVAYTIPNSLAQQHTHLRGSQILAINDVALAQDISDTEFEKLLSEASKQSKLSLQLQAPNQSEKITLELNTQTVCKVHVQVSTEAIINASATSSTITFTTGILERVTDTKLIQIVAGHELAHLTQNHSGKILRNLTVTGAIVYGPALIAVGSIADTVMGILPIKKPDVPLAARAMGVMMHPFGPDFEREADYVGSYFVVRAGIDLESPENVFRALALSAPKNTYISEVTHPVPQERMLAMKETFKEIKAKQAQGLALIPNGYIGPALKK
jgi:hypothetical protein